MESKGLEIASDFAKADMLSKDNVFKRKMIHLGKNCFSGTSFEINLKRYRASEV